MSRRRSRRGYMAAIARPPARLRIGLCETTFTGRPVHPECAEAVREAGRLLESLGHAVRALPARGRPRRHDPRLGGRGRLRHRAGPPRGRLGDRAAEDLVEPVSRGALAHAATLSREDYLEAINRIHAYGRQMAAAFETIDILLSAVMAEPPAEIGRFDHRSEDYLAYRLGRGGGLGLLAVLHRLQRLRPAGRLASPSLDGRGAPRRRPTRGPLRRGRDPDRALPARSRWPGPGSTGARLAGQPDECRCSMDSRNREASA